jgi:hypothetical protein
LVRDGASEEGIAIFSARDRKFIEPGEPFVFYLFLDADFIMPRRSGIEIVCGYQHFTTPFTFIGWRYLLAGVDSVWKQDSVLPGNARRNRSERSPF